VAASWEGPPGCGVGGGPPSGSGGGWPSRRWRGTGSRYAAAAGEERDKYGVQVKRGREREVTKKEASVTE
jgi:hypothetical protein